MNLPPIPVIDARSGGPPAVARLAEPGMRDLHRQARRTLTRPVLALSDAISRRWLERSGNPFRAEIAEIAALLGRPGAYALNASYEWACTSGVSADPEGGVRLLRVLDWRMHGLGRNLVAVWQRGQAGDFLNLTWPGYVGVVTAAAPNRFAAAINQPPLLSRGMTLPVDWLIERARLWRADGLPPAHLVRQACESCADYREAKELLCKGRICMPAFFVLAGAKPGEGCVIERSPDGIAVREMPAAIANHWVALNLRGRPRGRHSRERLARMQRLLADPAGCVATPPIVNRDTRVLAVINPARCLSARGWERNRPATAELSLDLRGGGSDRPGATPRFEASRNA